MPLRVSFPFSGELDRLRPTPPGIPLTTCRPISLANLQSTAALRPSRENLLAWKTKIGSREGKHGASTGQAEPGARRTHVRNPKALGRLGRQHVNAACSAAGRGGRQSARALSLQPIGEPIRPPGPAPASQAPPRPAVLRVSLVDFSTVRRTMLFSAPDVCLLE